MSATLAHIFRHPIKSHGREALASVRLSEGACLPWDRHWAVAHEAAKLPETGAWAPCANFSRGAKAPALMAITATLDAAAGTVTLRHPDRPDLTVDPETDGAALVDWVRPLCPPDRAQPARVVRAGGRGMTDTDYPSISVLNLASNAALGAHMGQDLSIARWRGNLWLDGLPAWAEAGLAGRRLRIGDAVLELREPITRCKATTANPDTGRIDADTLGALAQVTGGRAFGLYATVIAGGEIAPGMPVEVLQ